MHAFTPLLTITLRPPALRLVIALLTAHLAGASWAAAADPAAPPPGSRRAVMRVFFQDAESATLRWADLLATTPPQLSTPQVVAGFPQLDPQRQSLVQMAAAGGKLLVGVRDDEDGEFQSGWVLVDSGVEEEDHGDHSHWYYNSAPQVIATQLDEAQGNPAHLYCYEGVFYLANDRNGGFTRLDPSAIPQGADEAQIRSLAAFHVGGNGHITLAVAGELAFATWLSRDETNARRIDATRVSPTGSSEIAYSFHANSGRLHGATSASGKVFFAPAEGIDWIDVAASTRAAGDTVVHHLDLGSEEGVAYRTGAFLNHGGHVLFLSGRGPQSFLGLIDARRESPEIKRVAVDVDPASRASAPAVVDTRAFGAIVTVFHDHPQEVDAPNVASVIQLDPNRDGDYSDARLLKRIDVGPSRVEGHGGHHAMVTDAAGRFALISNPGDSSVQILSLADLSPQSTATLSFVPGSVVAIGGRGPIR